MAISIQPVNNFQAMKSAALTPSPDLIAQLAQTNLANPTLTSLQAASQEQGNALTNTTATNAAFETVLNALETQQALLAATGNTAGANSTTTAIPAATLNITPASTTQNSIATAAQQTLNVTSNTTATVQPFNTIPTTATNEKLLQDLLTQAANQALTTISSDPSYANSLTALLLSSGTARIRMVDETGTLLNTPEPVGPIRAVVRTKR